MSFEALHVLLHSISSSLSSLESSFASQSPPLDFPSLSSPSPSPADIFIKSNPHISHTINNIVGACGQLAASVRDPFLVLCDGAMSYHLASCLRFIEATHVVEIMREHGDPDAGMHVRDIVRVLAEHAVHIDQSKMAHILRLLATHHYFREVQPDYFARNRVSAGLDTGKSVEDIMENPEKKYEGTNGISAFVGLCTDELFKSSAYMTEAYLNPDSDSKSPHDTPFNHAFKTHKAFFEWLEEDPSPERTEGIWLKGQDGGTPPPKSLPDEDTIQRFRLARFGKAMQGNSAWDPPGGLTTCAGIDWYHLPNGSTLVDVGGGIGSASIALAESLNFEGNGLRFVVQDREKVVRMGREGLKKRGLLAESGKFLFQAHDFFLPQPPLPHPRPHPYSNALTIYLLRVVLHDWSDPYARKILQRLREGAGEETRLIIADHVLPLACEGDGDGALLKNMGKASANAYWMDMTMHVTFNAKERTLSEITALALSAGWKVDKITMASGGGGFAYILAKPCEPEESFFEEYSQEQEGDPSLDSTFSDAPMEQKSASVSMIESVSMVGRTSPAMPAFGFRPPTPFDMPVIERPENPVGRNGERGAWNTLKKSLSSSFLRRRMVKFPATRSGSSSGSDSEGEVVLGSHYLGLHWNINFPRSSSLDVCFAPNRSNS